MYWLHYNHLLGNVKKIVQYDTWHIAHAFSKNKGILIYIDEPFCTDAQFDHFRDATKMVDKIVTRCFTSLNGPVDALHPNMPSSSPSTGTIGGGFEVCQGSCIR